MGKFTAEDVKILRFKTRVLTDINEELAHSFSSWHLLAAVGHVLREPDAGGRGSNNLSSLRATRMILSPKREQALP